MRSVLPFVAAALASVSAQAFEFPRFVSVTCQPSYYKSIDSGSHSEIQAVNLSSISARFEANTGNASGYNLARATTGAIDIEGHSVTFRALGVDKLDSNAAKLSADIQVHDKKLLATNSSVILKNEDSNRHAMVSISVSADASDSAPYPRVTLVTFKLDCSLSQ